jgi:hypothetical protein
MGRTLSKLLGFTVLLAVLAKPAAAGTLLGVSAQVSSSDSLLSSDFLRLFHVPKLPGSPVSLKAHSEGPFLSLASQASVSDLVLLLPSYTALADLDESLPPNAYSSPIHRCEPPDPPPRRP